jgi:hypothetical protein
MQNFNQLYSDSKEVALQQTNISYVRFEIFMVVAV